MISDSLREAAYSQETDNTIIVLLTLTTPEVPEPLRICSVGVEKFADLGETIYGLNSNSNRYLFLPFEITLPQDDKTGAVQAKLTIDNVNREIINYARTTRSAITVDVQVVLSNDLDNVEIEFKGFKLTNVEYDAFKVSGNLSVDYLGLEPFPCGRFTPFGFRGLF